MTTKSLQDLLKAKDEIRKELRARGESLVKEEIEKFFADNPRVQGVTWTQYAPYFNDGDACIFSVHEFWVTHAEDAGDPSRYDGWEDSGEDPQCADASALEELIRDEDLLKMAFGDDCGVTALRTEEGVKIKSEPVDHD